MPNRPQTPEAVKRSPPFRFNLLSLFGLTSAVAVAVWVLYQWPFKVEKTTVAAAHQAAGTLPAPPTRVRREVEYVRRVWGGATVRHGPRHVFDGLGVLLEAGNYRNGVPHGLFQEFSSGAVVEREERYNHGLLDGDFYRRDPDGQISLKGSYVRGVPEGKWLWRTRVVNPLSREVRFDSICGEFRRGAMHGRWEGRNSAGDVWLAMNVNAGRLESGPTEGISEVIFTVLQQASVENPAIVAHLLAPISLDIDRMDLESVGRFLQDAVPTVRILVPDGPMVDEYDPIFDRTRTVSVSKLMISAKVKDAPLIIALNSLVHQRNLDLQYRDGALRIALERDEPASRSTSFKSRS